jgi:hypothetical protein
MKIDMTADEFRQWQQGNDTLNSKVIDLTVKLNLNSAALGKMQNDLYAEQQKTQDQKYTLDQNKRTIESYEKQINDPTSGWRKQLADANDKIKALDGKSAVPVAALKNLMTIVMGNPSDKKAAIDALRVLTLQSVKDATSLWDEIRSAALAIRTDPAK